MLKRQLGLWQAVLLGIGIMLGAGIYVLVGVAGAEAGDALWLSFTIGAVLALLTGFTYAELTSMFPNAGSSYYYSKQVFGSRRLSFLLGWLLIMAYTAMSTTVAFGFAQYMHNLVPVPREIIPLVVLFLAGALNYVGLRAASGFNTIATLLEVGGLLAFLYLFFASTGLAGLEVSFESPNGLPGIFSAAVFVFFAYLGFEVLPTAAEEVKNVRKVLPRAILISIALTSVLYILVGYAFTSALTHEQILQVVEDEKGALSVAAGQLGGPAFLLALGIVGLFSTSNTILVSIMGVSRMMYGMAEDKALPKSFLGTAKSGVPGFAILLATAFSMVLVFLGNLSFVARLAVAGIFVIFIMDNVAVILLRLRKPRALRPFRMPCSIAGVPLFPVIAILAMLGLLALEFLDEPLLLLGLLLLGGAGLGLNEAEKRLTGD